MASVIIGGGDRSLIAGARGNVCYTKRYWHDPWVLVPQLFCQQFTDTISPTTSSASFEYYFGLVLPPGATSATIYQPSQMVGNYVQVVDVSDWGSMPVWTGIIQHEETELYNDLVYTAGVQRLMAVGLEDTLDKLEINGSYTTSGRIDTDILFNRAGSNDTPTPNMVYDSDGFPIYCTPYHPGARWWTYYDVLIYLMRFWFPGNIVWRVDNPETVSQLGVITEDNFSFYTVRQALDRMFDRRKGLGWQLILRDNVACIRIVTDALHDISFGGAYIPANNDTIDVNFVGSRSTKATFKISEIAQYDGISVKGGAIYTTCTYTDANMVLANSVHMVDYEEDDEDTDEPPPPVTEPGDVVEPGDAAVKYTIRGLTRYIVDPAWDWVDPQTGVNCLPGVRDNGFVDGDLRGNLFFSGKNFERFLPFSSENGEQLIPFALARIKTGWVPIESVGNLGFTLLDDVPGVEFIGDDAVDIANRVKEVAITATIETDTKLAVHYHSVPVEFARNIKVIHHPSAIAHWVVPGTYLDTTYSGVLLRYNGLPLYYSDGAELDEIAVKAASWYCTPRSILEVEAHMITFEYFPGQFVRNNNNGILVQPVNTMITQRIISYDDQTTIAHTSFDELTLS